MKLLKITVSNFKCFGEVPLSVDFDDLTGFIGMNSTGKTALITALVRFFGEKASERNIQRNDFYLSPKEDISTLTNRSLFVELIFTFKKDEPSEYYDDTTLFSPYLYVDEPNGIPYLKLRLEATWQKGTTLEGAIDSNIFYVLREGESKIPAKRIDLQEIKLIYIPAVRKPEEQLRHSAGSIMYHLLSSITWSKPTVENLTEKIISISEGLLQEKGIMEIGDALSKNWNNFNQNQRCSIAKMNFFESNLAAILKTAEIKFFERENGRAQKNSELGDGLRSLFYLSLVNTMLTLETDNDNSLDLRPSVLTIIAVEEPENHVSPQILGKIMKQLLLLAENETSQVIVTSHSPAILKRIDPSSVRHFKYVKDSSTNTVNKLLLPNTEKQDAQFKYIKEAILAYPELYFSQAVILGEGDSEEIIIKKMLELKNIGIDCHDISVVPLGGRHVNHFWRLLNDLEIPFFTLLDLDRERFGGGFGRISYIIEQLTLLGINPKEICSGFENFFLNAAIPNELAEIKSEINVMNLTDPSLMNRWTSRLQEYDVYFSSPLDIDFAMLTKFKDNYLKTLTKQEGPRIPDRTQKTNEYEAYLSKCIKNTLKESGGQGNTYSEDEKELMIWYSYFFLGRGKPSTHRLMFSQNDVQYDDFPDCLKDFIQKVEKFITSTPEGGLQ